MKLPGIEDELRWYFAYSEAEMGLRGLPMFTDGAGETRRDSTGPSGKQLHAAHLQRLVRRALDELPAPYRGLLDVCYSPVSTYVVGVQWQNASRAVFMAELVRARKAEDKRQVRNAVERAHEAYAEARARLALETRDELRSARAAGQARRIVLLERLTRERPSKADRRAVALAAWLEEMGLPV